MGKGFSASNHPNVMHSRKSNQSSEARPALWSQRCSPGSPLHTRHLSRLIEELDVVERHGEIVTKLVPPTDVGAWPKGCQFTGLRLGVLSKVKPAAAAGQAIRMSVPSA